MISQVRLHLFFTTVTALTPGCFAACLDGFCGTADAQASLSDIY